MRRWFPILIFFIQFGSFISFSSTTEAQVDCVSPRKVSVGEIEGRVYDPEGVAVPGVVVSVDSDGVKPVLVQSDTDGMFRIKSSPRKYRLNAKMAGLEVASVTLAQGRDLSNSLHHTFLYVVLGLNGSSCPWITTSKREFLREVRANKKRFEEAAKNNATQK